MQVGVQVKSLILCLLDNELSVDDILKVYKQVYKSKWYFKKHTIHRAILEGYVEMTHPNNPKHPKQKYRLTTKGVELAKKLKNK